MKTFKTKEEALNEELFDNFGNKINIGDHVAFVTTSSGKPTLRIGYFVGLNVHEYVNYCKEVGYYNYYDVQCIMETSEGFYKNPKTDIISTNYEEDCIYVGLKRYLISKKIIAKRFKNKIKLDSNGFDTNIIKALNGEKVCIHSKAHLKEYRKLFELL